MTLLKRAGKWRQSLWILCWNWESLWCPAHAPFVFTKACETRCQDADIQQDWESESVSMEFSCFLECVDLWHGVSSMREDLFPYVSSKGLVLLQRRQWLCIGGIKKENRETTYQKGLEELDVFCCIKSSTCNILLLCEWSRKFVYKEKTAKLSWS